MSQHQPQPPSIPPYQGGGYTAALSAKDLSPSPYQGGGHTTAPSAEGLSPSPDKGRVGEGFASAYLPYNKNLTVLARENRSNPTAAENKIWQKILRMRQFAEYKFLRQKPIGNYIVDFYCARLQLVIEIDGDSHAETVEYDAERTRFLGSLGLRVIRFSNHEVLQNIEGIHEELVRIIHKFELTLKGTKNAIQL